MPVAPTPTRSSWSVCGTGVRPLTMIKASGEGGLELGVPGERRGARFRKAADGSLGRARGLLRRASRWSWSGTLTAPSATSTSRRSGSPGVPYDPERDIPGGVDTAGWH